MKITAMRLIYFLVDRSHNKSADQQRGNHSVYVFAHVRESPIRGGGFAIGGEEAINENGAAGRTSLTAGFVCCSL